MATNKRLIKSNDEGGGVAASFNTVLYDGNGGVNLIDDVGFTPDLIWIKNRDKSASHHVFDSLRADDALFTNETSQEVDYSAYIETDIVGGFKHLQSSISLNLLDDKYVAWCWKAGGSAVTNTDGTITSQVSANTEAGFSVVSYNGASTTSGDTKTIGHGLGVAPKMVITKATNLESGWLVYHTGLTSADYFIRLNEAGGESAAITAWGNTAPTSSVFSVDFSTSTGRTGYEYIAYCFAEVEGFSSFGSYVGTGAAVNTVVTGFEPAFVMIKNSDDTGDWVMFDNKRNPTNPVNNRLMANLSSQESQNSTTRVLNFLTNGFSINSTNQDINAINDNYIYMAFANQF